MFGFCCNYRDVVRFCDDEDCSYKVVYEVFEFFKCFRGVESCKGFGIVLIVEVIGIVLRIFFYYGNESKGEKYEY